MEAGLKLFIEKGLLATSVSEIASLAGISKGLMYHYYKSKEELYYELVGNAINSSTEYMQNISNMEASSEDKIRLVSKKIAENIIKNDDFAQNFIFINRALLSENIVDKANELIKNAYAPIELTEKIIIEGQKDGGFKQQDPRAMAMLYWSSIHGLCANKLISSKLTTKDKFIALSSSLLDEILLKR
jgi:AcrR family transcriptional regulator